MARGIWNRLRPTVAYLFISAVLKANAHFTLMGPRTHVAVESKRKLGMWLSHVWQGYKPCCKPCRMRARFGPGWAVLWELGSTWWLSVCVSVVSCQCEFIISWMSAMRTLRQGRGSARLFSAAVRKLALTAVRTTGTRPGADRGDSGPCLLVGLFLFRLPVIGVCCVKW